MNDYFIRVNACRENLRVLFVVFVVKDRMGNPAILPDPSYNYCFVFPFDIAQGMLRVFVVKFFDRITG